MQPVNSPVMLTVIAVCYNHERFVIECLESIRLQTCRDFQLIVVDDKSTDDSQRLISEWMSRYFPAANLILHQTNIGLCRTLNEALRISDGRYVALIATDDRWEPGRLAYQLEFISQLSEAVALVYSDATQIDEDGNTLPLSFIKAHRPGREPPSGRIFSALADGNFIPGMATLIRRDAIAAIGGYDESLTYEDYDMWLRLASRFEIVFAPGSVASYRIVSTSMVRTLFDRPTARHSFSVYSILDKWIGSGLLSPTQKEQWAEKIAASAYSLYVWDDPRATRCLWRAFLLSRKPRLLLLAALRSIGFTRPRAKRVAAMIRPS